LLVIYILIISFILFIYFINRLVIYPMLKFNKIKNKTSFRASNKLLNIAHRGGGLESPENTLYAFQKSIETAKADMLEIDVRVSADNEAVVIHNDTLVETTNGHGKVSDYTVEELQNLDAGYNFSLDNEISFPFRGKAVRIPTLEELFKQFPNTPINIDIKMPSKPLVKRVVQLINAYSRTDNTIIGSNYYKVWRIIKKETSLNRFIFFFPPQEVLKLIIFHLLHLTPLYKPKYPVLELPLKVKIFNFTNPRFLREVKLMNFELFFWTVNEETVMKKLLKSGVDGIMTDIPSRFNEIRNNFAH